MDLKKLYGDIMDKAVPVGKQLAGGLVRGTPEFVQMIDPKNSMAELLKGYADKIAGGEPEGMAQKIASGVGEFLSPAPAAGALKIGESVAKQAYNDIVEKGMKGVKPGFLENPIKRKFSNITTPKLDNPYASFTEDMPLDELMKYAKQESLRNPVGSSEYEALKSKIKTEGIKDPLILGYDREKKLAELVEGNHRLSIAKELGLENVPVRASNTGVLRGGVPVKGYNGDFTPMDLKPSEILEDYAKKQNTDKVNGLSIDEYVKQAKLPPQKQIPSQGTLSYVRTDDGGIYFDVNDGPHALIIEKQNIPPERVVGGGFIKDGEFLQSESPNAAPIGEQARSQKRVEFKRKLNWDTL